jgi:diguanylate cyclase (GGDEF)-like protein/PAS domain S-box-containing protein
MNDSFDHIRDGRVLVVDDERVNVAIVSCLLQGHGYHTYDAYSGPEALHMVSAHRPDLVLLDIGMPDMDGFAVLQQLREEFTAFELPVIMVTAQEDSTQAVRAFQSGANDYVTKPIDAEVTLARVGTQIRLRRAQLALRESEERYALAARGTNDGLWDWNLGTDQMYYSPRWCQMLGLDPESVGYSSTVWIQRIHPEDRERVKSELHAHRRGDTHHFETELRMLHSDGSYRWMLCRGLAVRDEDNTAIRMAGSLTDITEGKVADGLTGLPNRLLFLDRLQRSIDRKQLDGRRRFAILFLDIDNFKLVNDSLGHETGDQLLTAFAHRLESCVRSTDTIVSRLGGDEFAVLVEHLQSFDDAKAVADRILETMSRPFVVKGREVFAAPSIGIALSSKDCARAEDMLREADTAMYEAKSDGKGNYQVYNPDMQRQVASRLSLQSDLRRVLERDELVLNYQPIVTLETGRTVGTEALVRWHHPVHGQVAPDKFIPAAEETGMIVPIGAWVLREACRQTMSWQKQSPQLPDLIVSVNVSSRQLAYRDILRDVEDVLESTSIRPECLKLEVTESAIMDNPEDVAKMLRRLREMGVRIGVDDFGTGYSSLAYLHRLPLDVLKIDRSFVHGLIQGTENVAIVKTIVSLAANLNLDVIAEGIETEEQREILLSMGCKYGQGYLFSRPIDGRALFRLLCDEATRGQEMLAVGSAYDGSQRFLGDVQHRLDRVQ